MSDGMKAEMLFDMIFIVLNLLHLLMNFCGMP